MIIYMYAHTIIVYKKFFFLIFNFFTYPMLAKCINQKIPKRTNKTQIAHFGVYSPVYISFSVDFHLTQNGLRLNKILI